MTTTYAAVADRAEILGCSVDRLDMESTLRRCLEYVDQRHYAQHLAVNAAKLVAMQDDPELRAIARNCAIVNADGQSVVWAAKVLRTPLPSRVAGIDLMHRLLDAAERDGHRVYVLGAKHDVLERALARLRELHPALQVAGARDGYFADAEAEAVCEEIRAARPDMLFVAMSSPRKERFLGAYGSRLGVPFVMGVGGAVDVLAGDTRRAPALWQRLGIEWLYRTLQEPRRLGPRYLRTNGRFVALVAREAIRSRMPASRAAR